MLLAAGALSAGQLAAFTLAATFALSVLERLLKRWKASMAALLQALRCCDVDATPAAGGSAAVDG